MSILSKLIYKFNAISIKIPAGFFCRYRQLDSKIYMQSKDTRRAKTILKKKNKVGRVTLPDFKAYFKAARQQDSVELMRSHFSV